jgi:predicted anti-sigma-YlaC factor YlaD
MRTNWCYSCRKLAELLSQRLDERLGPLDAVRLRVHLSVCANCSNVEKQLAGLSALAADLFSGDSVPSDGARSSKHSDSLCGPDDRSG